MIELPIKYPSTPVELSKRSAYSILTGSQRPNETGFSGEKIHGMAVV